LNIVAQNLWVPPLKRGSQNCHFRVFLKFRDLSATIFGTNGTIDKKYLQDYMNFGPQTAEILDGILHTL